MPCSRLYGPRYIPFPYSYGARYSSRPSIARLWCCNSSSWRRAVLLSLTAFATPAVLPINDPSAPNIGKLGNTPSRSLSEVSVSSPCFSLSSSSSSYPYRSSSWLLSPLRQLWLRLSHPGWNLSRRCVFALSRRVSCPPRVSRWDRYSESTLCRARGTPWVATSDFRFARRSKKQKSEKIHPLHCTFFLLVLSFIFATLHNTIFYLYYKNILLGI